jgi:hypothetical protein
VRRRCQRVGHGFGDESLALVPGTGLQVQGFYPPSVPPTGGDGRGGLVQPLPKQLGKQRVVAIPVPAVVEWDDEQVGAVEIFQDGLRTEKGPTPCSR